MTKDKVFEKQVKLQGQGHKLWYCNKGLPTRSTHASYESPVSYGSEESRPRIKFLSTDNNNDSAGGMTLAVLTFVTVR